MEEKKLSNLAETLLELLKESKKGVTNTECAEFLFDKPKFPEDKKDEAALRAFWQWDADCYGQENWRTVGPGKVLPFKGKEKTPYAVATRRAFLELKEAGLAVDKGTSNADTTYHFKEPDKVKK